MSTTVWRDVVVTAGRQLGSGPLADVVSAAIEDELPLVRSDPDLRALARSSSAANVELIIEMISGRSSPDAYEPPAAAIAFIRELAHRNVPVDELSQAYHLAQHALWRWAIGQLNEHIADPRRRADAIERLSDAAFSTGQLLNSRTMEEYAKERERWLRSADAVRRATVMAVLEGGAIDPEASSRRLRYELRQPHQAFVVWSEDEDTMPETAAAAIGGPHALLVSLGVGVIAGWTAPGLLAFDRADAPVRIAVGTIGQGLRGFRDSHREAMEARRVARLSATSDRAVHYDDVALLAILTRDVGTARRFATRNLGPLAADDPTTRRLADTLLCLFEEQGSPRRAAQRLGIHENTVGKRLRAIDALGGPSTSGGRNATALMASLVILQALRRDEAAL